MPTPRTPPLKGESQLIEQAVAGDANSFGLLYLHYMDTIYRFIGYRVEDEILAEDLTEEVFLKAWVALPRFVIGAYPLSTWLYTIARNLIIDLYRKRHETPLNDLHQLHVQKVSTEDAVEHKLESAALRQAILSLPSEEQQVIILRFIEDLPHQQIAVIIGKSEGVCRVIQHRALKHLQLALASSHESSLHYENRDLIHVGSVEVMLTSSLLRESQ